MNSLKKQSRIAAALYFLNSLPAPLALLYVPGVLLVRGDAAATSNNVRNSEALLRLGMAGELFSSTIVIFAVLAFYTLVFTMLWLLTTLNLLGALRLLGNASYLYAFDADRLQVLARLHIAASFDDYYVGLPFFGLAATVCAWLWLKSNYIPKALALFGVISSAWCVICVFVFLIFPGFAKPVNPYWFDSPMAIFEMTLSLWLLLRGLRLPRLADQFPASN